MSESLTRRTSRRVATAVRAVSILKNWPTYFMDYASAISADRITYSLRNGLRYELRPNTADRGIFTEVWLRDDYARALDSLSDGDRVIDLGAQAGLASTFFAYRTGCIVYAYEPLDANFELLTRNVRINLLSGRVLPFKVAVSDARGQVPLYLSPSNTGGHSMLCTQGAAVNVDCITLDDVFDQNRLSDCALLKVDVEGSEYRIFYGCRPETLLKVRTIVLEYHEFPDVPGHNHRDLTRFLEQSGFRVSQRAPYLYCRRT